MEGGRQGRGPFDHPFFTSPFGSMDQFASSGGFGGPMNQGGLVPSFFGGRNPFDDPFFSQPFGGVFGSMESSLFGMSPFPSIAPPRFIEQQVFTNAATPGLIEQRVFANTATPGLIEQRVFANTAPPGFIEQGSFPNMVPYGFMNQQTFPNLDASGINDRQSFPHMGPSGSNDCQGPQPKRQRGLVIEEINSDEESEEVSEKIKSAKKDGSPHDGNYVEYPDDRVNARSQQRVGNDHSHFGNLQQQPPNHSFTFQSSSVTIGGANGPYYASSMTRRTGSDGVTFEERKEADSTTREATHRIRRGILEKGHSVERKLKSDGKVDTVQVLHNLEEEELAGFQESWKNNAKRHLPVLDRNSFSSDAGSSAHNVQSHPGGWALPSAECPQGTARHRLM